jgi:hypothetical protein
MLKYNFISNALLDTLKILNININKSFDKKHLGYYNSSNIEDIQKHSKKINLFTNKLSKNEIIVSNKEIRLGKEKQLYKNGKCITTYHSMDEYNYIKKSYKNIKSIDSVPEMEFIPPKTIVRDIIKGTTLLNNKNNLNELYKHKLIRFIKEMNIKGYAHRDLHCKNIIVNKHELFVIDWDFIIEQKCDILKSYDLTGKGMTSPHLTYNCNIFKSFPIMNIPSVSNILNISLEEFIL